MKALVGAFNQEKALVGAFSVIVQPVVEPMDRFTALVYILLGSHSFWTVPGAVHGGQQLVVAQGLEVGHILRRGVAEVQC